MKRLLIIPLLVAAIIPVGAANKQCKKSAAECADAKVRAEIAATPEKSGGYYYAYPYTTDSMARVPKGFEPVYVSHYGRHGSRWVSSSSLHRKVAEVLQNQKEAGNLTKDGDEILRLVKICDENSKGHIGELTRLGELQHAAIAKRMAARMPNLFEGENKVLARSSTSQRCIISMAAFTEALKELNPKLDVKSYCTPSDMKIIAYHSKAAKAIYDDPQAWKVQYEPKKDSLYSSLKTASRIFYDAGKVKDLPAFMKNLQDVAKAVQNVDGLDVNILQYFDAEDLYNLWKGEDYVNYVRHGNAIETNAEGPKSAKNLLTDIIERADKSLAGEGTKADLRFGHDIFLMRLVALMDVPGTNDAVSGIDDASRVWQSYRITPMAANLQLIYYQNPKKPKDTIVTIRLNERPIKIDGVKEYSSGFYKWDDLKRKWNTKLTGLNTEGGDGKGPVDDSKK